MKTNRIITARMAAILAALMLASTLASCSRRDQFRPPETDAPTGEQTTVAGQPDVSNPNESNPNESTPTETIPGGEESTKPNSSNNPDDPPTFAPPLSDGTETPKITGNPYEGWTKEELYASFQKEAERKELGIESYRFGNTPYYVIFDAQYGGYMFSKLTGQVMQICKDPLCDHENCIFSNHTFYGHFCQVVDDRVYILLNQPRENILVMYSFDLLMNDAKVVGEWSDTLDNVYIYRDKIYYITTMKLENGQYGWGAMAYDMTEKTAEPLWEEAIPCYSVHYEGGYAWYTSRKDGSLRRYDLDTGEDVEILSAKLLNRENGETAFVCLSVSPKTLYIQKRIVPDNVEHLELDLETGAMRKVEYINAWEYNSATYALISHKDEANQDDPHYEYYFNTTTDGLGVAYGGKMFRKDAATGEMKPIFHFCTDGIPDCIQGTLLMDGGFVLVQYQTYKDFRNPYNPSAPEWANSYRYIVYNMETGQAYEMGVDISNQSMHNRPVWY